MTTEQLNRAFADIHKGAATLLGNDFDRYEPFRRYVKYDVIDPLVEAYKKEHPTISWGDSYLAVRDAYMEYIGTLFPREGITARPIPLIDFESKQTPVLDDDGKFHCCYRRKKKNLSAFRHQTCTLKGQKLIDWYHHSSPVPYEVTDKPERRGLTIQNLQQLAAQDPGKPIAEVRLLSPLTGLKATLASPFAQKYFTELNDYDQLLETAVAAKLSGLDITLFNFGVNSGRYLTNELQTQLNIRALKKLYAKITGTPLPPTFELDPNTPTVEQSFLEQLAAQNPENYTDLPQDIDGSSASEKQKELFRTLMHLLSSGDWKKNNFMAQALLVILLHSLGYLTATGCNDAKDRDGELTNYIEALLVYMNTKELSFEEILKHIRENSTARKVAEEISMPEVAKDLDVKGNSHRKISRTFKHLFTEARHEHYKERDRIEAEESKFVPASTSSAAETVDEKKGWWNTLCEIGTAIKNGLVRFFTGILLAIGLMSVAQADTAIIKDGASPLNGGSSFSVPLTGDETPSVPQPASKRDDVVAADDSTSEEEDEDVIEEDGTPKSSPPVSRKSHPEEEGPVKSWKDVVRERGGNTANLSVRDKIHLMRLRGNSSPPHENTFAPYKVAEEDLTGMPSRRRTF